MTSLRNGDRLLGRGARTGLALAVVVLTAAGSAVSAPPGALVVEAPPELTAEARRLESLDTGDLESFRQLIGLGEPGPPVRVVLLPEASEPARRAPPWVTAYAVGGEDLVVLFPHRIPSYPHASLAEVVRHELAHVLVARAAADRPLPRWFHEGLAMVAEGGWQLGDHSRLALAVLRSSEPEPDDLNALFRSDRQRVAAAYAISGAFVRSLLRRHGRQLPARLLAAVRGGGSFDEAFTAVTGSSEAAALHAFWRRSAVWYRWVPFVTSSTVLWIGITLLALVAIRRRRERDRAILARWEEEDAAGDLERERDELIN